MQPTVDKADVSVDDVDAITKFELEVGEIVNPSEFVKYYAPDASLYDGLAPGVYHGIDAIIDTWAEQLQGTAKVSAEFVECNVEVSGDLGCVNSIQRINVSSHEGRQHVVICRVTDILKRVAGRWLIVHQHISYPVDRSSGLVNYALHPAGTS